ncbi:ATP-binding protein [Xenorhabdus bovienii]|uniref:ATP-binding protein n=1 Tax=Xenorhabdus bovienii TaxID=40576 RepID=UPI0023B26EB6|nr:ATP-binding protein [Xenorhabdus bovienii]MDE9455319.1 ATP-binding protein [Xenorhabdus bovienii]
MTQTDLLGAVNISPRFAQASFANYQLSSEAAKHNLGICQNYAHSWEVRKQAGEGLVLCGRPGTGKTHLAVAICRVVATEKQARAFMTTASRIIRAFRRSWNHEAEQTEFETLQFYSEMDLLVIDEIGVQYGTDSERNILFEVINNRYEDLLPTILISNLPLSDLSGFLGERIIDRMSQGGVVLAFNWDSYRRGK